MAAFQVITEDMARRSILGEVCIRADLPTGTKDLGVLMIGALVTGASIAGNGLGPDRDHSGE
jgi:hypothetical protein